MSYLIRRQPIREGETPQGDEAALTQWAKKAMRMAPGPSQEERALFVADTVARQAKRLGFNALGLSRWLQTAYGEVWVKGGSLNPGIDMPVLRKRLLKNFAGL